MSTRLPEPVLYELRGRRSYVAQILGPDRQYGMQREFCDRRYSVKGKKGLWAKILQPGWYEVSTAWGFDNRKYKRRWEAFDGVAWTEIPKELAPWLPVAPEGPAPGQAGAWASDRCECGEPVAHYTPDGWPVCESEECHARF